MRHLHATWLGLVPYAEASAMQEALVTERRSGHTADRLLLLEHPPVVTLGRRADSRHVLCTPEELARNGVECFETGRGGDVTYHGPGQVVGYPIVALAGERRDAHRYLRDLEQALIGTAADYGVTATRVPGKTGAWVDGEKLAAIGVRLNTGWITSHGFAFNVGSDLDGFAAIVPCGLRSDGVTSLGRRLGYEPALPEVARRLAAHTADALGLELLMTRAAPAPALEPAASANPGAVR